MKKNRRFVILVVILSVVSIFSILPVELPISTESVEKVSKLLPVILENKEISRINFIVLGNSIANGFTLAGGKSIPLLERSEEFISLLEQDLPVYHYKFARPQDTTNIRLLKLIASNRRLDVMNLDAVNGIRELDERYGKEEANLLTSADIDKYYSDKDPNVGIRDLLSDNNSINIVILNCNVGAAISKFDRGINLQQKITSIFAMSKDFRDLNSLFQEISVLGENNYVFMTGINKLRILNVFNIGISAFNMRLKDICNNFLNVQYVKPITAKGIYFNPFLIDIHPNKEEYLRIIENYFESVNDNIMRKIILNDIYNTFEKIADERNIYKNYKETSSKIIIARERLKNKYRNSETDFKKAMKEFHKYYRKNYDCEFYRLPENLIFDE